MVSSGPGTWAQVSGLMKNSEWDKVFIIGDEFAKKFTHDKKFEFIKVDLSATLMNLKDELSKKLKDKFQGLEVALSMASGSGKEHMALMSALINLPMGIRFAALTKDGVVDL